ncbi:hypothetical protein BH23GEM3_BH23GEM3_02400 [soil metagenome]|nr:hypothetical protein [Gemmatimonadota bacterium]
MSRVFVDEDLLSWEVYASGGQYGLPDDPKIVFHCVSDPSHRPRFVRFGGSSATAVQAVHDFPIERLRQVLNEAEELD